MPNRQLGETETRQGKDKLGLWRCSTKCGGDANSCEVRTRVILPKSNRVFPTCVKADLAQPAPRTHPPGPQ